MINAKPRWTKAYIDALNRAITDTVTAPVFAYKLKDDGLIQRHQRSGWWSTVSVYYNFRHNGAEAFGFYNLKDPANNKITKVGTGITFTPKVKVLFNGSAGYYNTNWPIGSGQYFTTTNQITLRITDNAGLSGFVYGTNAVGVRFTNISGDNVTVNSGSGTSVNPNTTPIGACILVVRRISSTQVQFNRNGVNDGTKNQNFDTAFPVLNMFLGCRSNNGTASGVAGNGIAFWSAGVNTSDALSLSAYNDEIAYEASL